MLRTFILCVVTSVGINTALEFPVKRQPAAKNSTCLTKQQEIFQLFTSFDSLHQQVDGIGQNIDALQKIILSKLDSISIFAAAKSDKVIAKEITKNKPRTYAGAVSLICLT